MAISIEGYKPSLAIKHKDHKGRACPGTFHFTDHVLGHKNALAAFTDRSCSHCDRRETYEMDQLILVAKTDVPINTLTEFCNAIIKEAEIKMKDQPPLEGESKEIKLVSIVKDATNPLRFAAILQIMNPGIDVDAYRFMEELAINAWSRNQQLPMYADTYVCGYDRGGVAQTHCAQPGKRSYPLPITKRPPRPLLTYLFLTAMRINSRKSG